MDVVQVGSFKFKISQFRRQIQTEWVCKPEKLLLLITPHTPQPWTLSLLVILGYFDIRYWGFK